MTCSNHSQNLRSDPSADLLEHLNTLIADPSANLEKHGWSVALVTGTATSYQ